MSYSQGVSKKNLVCSHEYEHCESGVGCLAEIKDRLLLRQNIMDYLCKELWCGR